MKVELLIIDPQYDFCHPKGSLYVEGAYDDMIRLAHMIKRLKSKIDKIHVTLDGHSIIHIAHPVFWKDARGNHPEPFTIITVDDIKNSRWVTTNPFMMEKAASYVYELAKKKRYNLLIWPPHCIRGSIGATIIPELLEALQAWEQERFRTLNIITKGENIWTEHYSAIKAEVPDSEDPKTEINHAFINMLKEADVIGIAGEALSHCVANTVLDIADFIGSDYLSRFVLLEDATSPVKGFEQSAQDFKNYITSKGMRLSDTKNFL